MNDPIYNEDMMVAVQRDDISVLVVESNGTEVYSLVAYMKNGMRQPILEGEKEQMKTELEKIIYPNMDQIDPAIMYDQNQEAMRQLMEKDFEEVEYDDLDKKTSK
jgi:hypothetical protein